MIALRKGESLAEVVPERGAICSRLRLGPSEMLFLDPATLADAKKNVRGGIPLLFPIAGKPDPGSSLPLYLKALGETLSIALLGTTLAAVMALPVSCPVRRRVERNSGRSLVSPAMPATSR